MRLKEVLSVGKTIHRFMEEEARSYDRVKHLYPLNVTKDKSSGGSSH